MPSTHDARGVIPFRGGETAALGRMKTYFWDKNALKDYKVSHSAAARAARNTAPHSVVAASLLVCLPLVSFYRPFPSPHPLPSLAGDPQRLAWR